VTTADAPLADDESPEFAPPPWPGPDLYALRGWVEVEVASDSGVTLDAAHAVLTDVAERAFGRRVFDWVGEALADEGRGPDDLAALVADADLAARILVRLRERMGEEDEAPHPPSEEYGWYAYSPDDPEGARESFRRAVRRRKQHARHALLAPRRPRVAGRRDR
jgi:hypothetical protein